ncbi:hypothetical protein FJU30_11065 [Affinibrenneria salicis]|uniref:Uncharacterized protein n=1 Tax=Affinibrenneria salicis TaxID=2590031 RepID=A0A5J5G1V6_9GAMM|nr:hypothetical protein FJU30_11065 [Affinibrenneria salicis]
MVIASSKCIHFSEVVTLVVLTEKLLPFSLFISHLLAKAISVRGVIYLFSCILANPYLYIDSTG